MKKPFVAARQAVGEGMMGEIVSSQIKSPLSSGMFFLALFAFFAIGRVADPFPFLWPFRLIMVTGAIAAISWVQTSGSLEEKIPYKIPQVRYVLWLAALAIIIIPFSVWPMGSFETVTSGLWQLVLVFILVSYWCRSMQDARWLIWMCCIGVSTLVLSGLMLGDFNSTSQGEARFSAGSTKYDPNDLALLLAMLVPFIVFLLSTSRLIGKFLALGIGLVCLYGLILTQSRGGFLALATVVSLLLFRSKLKLSQKFIILVAIVLVFSLAGAMFWNRMGTIWNPQDEYDATAGNRTGTWKIALSIMAARPWGAGYGLCDVAIGEASGGGAFMWNTAHNSYLQVGVELGILGLGVFLSLLMRTLKDLRRAQSLSGFSQHSPERQLASMLEISLYSFLVGGFFLSQAYSMFLYLIIGLSLVFSRKAANEHQGALHHQRSAFVR